MDIFNNMREIMVGVYIYEIQRFIIETRHRFHTGSHDQFTISPLQ